MSYQQCEPGTYELAVDCLPCQAGRYSNAMGQTRCLLCASGEYSPGLGASECQRCPSGRFQSDSGGVNCTGCAVGKPAHHTCCSHELALRAIQRYDWSCLLSGVCHWYL